MRTLYEVLGVDRHATRADIELSYRHSLDQHLAATRMRPLPKKDQRRLQQMRKAYLVLASPNQRLEYDVQLEKTMRMHLRLLERVGAALGVLLLVAGVALIVAGIYRLWEPHTATADRATGTNDAIKSATHPIAQRINAR